MANEYEDPEDIIAQQEAEESGRIVEAEKARREAVEKKPLTLSQKLDVFRSITDETPLPVAAEKYATCGIKVFRLQVHGKEPLPKTHGHNDATADLETVREWWGPNDKYNIGVVCDENFFTLIDIDKPTALTYRGKPHEKDGAASLKAAGITMPETLTADTWSGGQHKFLLYAPDAGKCDSDIKVGPNNIELKGVDRRNEGKGYAVVAPSIVKADNGSLHQYRWSAIVEPAPYPEALKTLPARTQEEIPTNRITGNEAKHERLQAFLDGSRPELPTQVMSTADAATYDVERIKRSVRISTVLKTLGIAVLNDHFVAVWRGGDGMNISFDDAKGLWCDHARNDSGGDIIALVQNIRGCSFRDACKWLCETFFLDATKKKSQSVEYVYTDENGKPIFFVIRKVPKDFRQGHYDENGKKVWKMKGVRSVPFHLPRLIEGVSKKSRIFIVEGEKDVENVEKLGLYATCNAGGAGEWRVEYSDFFKGAGIVTIIADRDGAEKDFPGQRHAEQVRVSLERAGVKASVVYVGDASCKDASDWIAKGATADDFNALADNPPPWVPPWQSQEATATAGDGDGDGATQGEEPEAEEAPPTFTPEMPPLDWDKLVQDLPGLIGDIARYALDNAMTPCPQFAVEIALATIAAILNRHVHENGRGNFAQFFGAALAPSGIAKNDTVALPRSIIQAASKRLRRSLRIYMAGMHSESGIAARLEVDSPAIIMLLDEAQDDFKLAKAQAKLGGSAVTFKTALRKLFNATYGWEYEAKQGAKINGKAQRSIVIPNACFSITFNMQNDEVCNSFGESDFSDGLLSRFIYFIISEDAQIEDRMKQASPFPEVIIDEIAAILAEQNFKLINPKDPNNHDEGYSEYFDSTPIAWTEESWNILVEFKRYCSQREKEAKSVGAKTSTLWRRAAQHAMRIALIIACGRLGRLYRNAVIEIEDISIATEIVVDCVQRACLFLENQVLGDPFDEKRLKIRKYIAKFGARGRTKTEIAGMHFGDCSLRRKVLEDEELAKFVVVKKVLRNGRSVDAYVITPEGKKQV